VVEVGGEVGCRGLRHWVLRNRVAVGWDFLVQLDRKAIQGRGGFEGLCMVLLGWGASLSRRLWR